MKTRVYFDPNPRTEYEGRLGDQTFRLAPAYPVYGWYAQWQDAVGENCRTLRLMVIDAICDLWRESGFDLRRMEWAEIKRNVQYGYNPFIGFNEPALWGHEIGNVYFALDPSTRLIKIGNSRQYKKRMNALFYEYRTSLTVLGLLEGTDYDEKELHKTFAQYGTGREWFSDCQPIRDFIAQYCYDPSKIG